LYEGHLVEGRQALATPLAESMRRLRLVFFGAGLVGLYFQQQSRRKNTKVTTATVTDSTSMEQLASQAIRSNPNGGVILRLVDHPMSTVPPGRLPIVYPHTLNSLERLPLDDKWFLHINKNAHKSLVTESNTCPPLSQCFSTHNKSVLTKYSTPLDFAVHSTIRSVARVANRNDATLVQVCIGSGPSAEIPKNSIYLDGLQAVAEKLVQSIEKAHATYSLQRQQQSTTNPENDGNNLQSAESKDPQVVQESEQASESSESHRMDIFERLGLKIRQGIQIPTNVLARAVKRWDRGPKPVLYVVSDHADFWNWLDILLIGYRLEWLDPEQGVEAYPKTGGIFLVFCSTDEKTSQVVTSIMDEATDNRHVVALMDKEWVQNVTLKMIQDGASSANANVQIQCAETIHRDLFDHVQKLLTSGWTPERIQKSEPKS
jgi:hypothetical protein